MATPVQHPEHQVVVFDVTAPDLLTAGRKVASHLQQTNRRMETLSIESWWMPEEPLRTQIDGNDNPVMELVALDLCPSCEGAGEHNICPTGCDGSHVLDEPQPCRLCHGLGVASARRILEWEQQTDPAEDGPS